MKFSQTHDWDELESAEAFLAVLADKNITYALLKEVIFGRTAIKVIASVRKHGDPCYKTIIKFHQAWYCTKVALSEVVKKQARG